MNKIKINRQERIVRSYQRASAENGPDQYCRTVQKASGDIKGTLAISDL